MTPDFKQSLLALNSQLAQEKRLLNLTEVVNELPHVSPTTCDDATLHQYLNALYTQGRTRHTPNISPINTVFLQTLLQQHQPKRILEIGCANGYSTLRFWQEARAWQAHICTLEISTPNIIEAKHHFAATGANITLYEGNALELMPHMTDTSFNFIFIDARKIKTLDFFIQARRLAAPKALIVIDDVLKFKDKMQNFYDYLAQEQITYHIETIDDDEDGVMLVQL
ncbi:O-methyltransferase [Hydromonas duriensis]|uniref:Putative O-methyltransferase YrrM n=1 Tax=Hydromonas duriensis TaxID=1527608 RepID=A0A4R6Y713_9BURK|nr:class I SAM-dependent methyltransferase [Hydromonas duriensis]TDR30586.1 putative O-methyltransferase YrrM [Hydromonas duriensis]